MAKRGDVGGEIQVFVLGEIYWFSLAVVRPIGVAISTAGIDLETHCCVEFLISGREKKKQQWFVEREANWQME